MRSFFKLLKNDSATALSQQLPRRGSDVRDISHPGPVRLLDGKLAFQSISRDNGWPAVDFSRYLVAVDRADIVLPHDSGNSRFCSSVQYLLTLQSASCYLLLLKIIRTDLDHLDLDF